MFTDAAALIDEDERAATSRLVATSATDFLDPIGTSDRADLVPARPPAGSEAAPGSGSDRVRVAILSFLFNWPSTGGGTVHTFELAAALVAAGFEVRHIYARSDEWGIGGVAEPLPYPSTVIDFTGTAWDAATVRDRFRRALDAFEPDRVIITDSWNSKPLLAEAARGYPTVLRFQASECLCPLNNVRLLPGDRPGRFRQCGNHQLAGPGECAACVSRWEHCSGDLHRAERALVGYGTVEYHHQLLSMFRHAAVSFVVNPLMEAMISPYTPATRVVTAGMDPRRFASPQPPPPRAGRPFRFLFAGLIHEPMKGFAVLHAAARRLRQSRTDFELVVTADPAGQFDEFTRLVGWQSQDDLPAQIAAADAVVVPTVAQEALGRTAVEAMAGARPVIASRIGGLPFTVLDEATGLLVEPEDPAALADAMARLLDDADLGARLGRAGRRRFLETYAWPVIIDRAYRPILLPRAADGSSADTDADADADADVDVEFDPAGTDGFEPVFNPAAEPADLVASLASFGALEVGAVARLERSYHRFDQERGYEATVGEFKTLCRAEAFVLGVALATCQPAAILVLEGPDGRALTRISDLRTAFGVDCRIIAAGEFAPRAADPGGVERVAGSPLGQVGALVAQTGAGLIYLDRHEPDLVAEVIGLAVRADQAGPGRLTVALHDCAAGLCNPSMRQRSAELPVSSRSGVWQRHLLAEALGVDDPLSADLDAVAVGRVRLRIFATTHGLALLIRSDHATTPDPAATLAGASRDEFFAGTNDQPASSSPAAADLAALDPTAEL